MLAPWLRGAVRRVAPQENGAKELWRDPRPVTKAFPHLPSPPSSPALSTPLWPSPQPAATVRSETTAPLKAVGLTSPLGISGRHHSSPTCATSHPHHSPRGFPTPTTPTATLSSTTATTTASSDRAVPAMAQSRPGPDESPAVSIPNPE